LFPFGAADCKTTDAENVGQHNAWIQDGPTTELNPPFSWANWPQYANDSIGMPTVWNFSWVNFKPFFEFGPQTQLDMGVMKE